MNLSTRTPIHQKIIFALFLALVFWIPWPLGGNRPWAWPIMSTLTFFLLFSWSFAWSRTRTPLPDMVKKAKLPLILMGSWLIYLILQIIPLPNYLLSSITTVAEGSYVVTEGEKYFGTISVDKAATFEHLLKSSTYVALFFLVLVLVQNPKDLKKIIWTILITAILQTIYGAFSIGEIDAFVKASHNTLQGSYPNRNHYAGLMEMSLSMGVGLFMTYHLRTNLTSFSNHKVLSFITLLTGVQSLILAAIVVILIGLLLSQSRGAFLSFSLSFFIIFFCWFFLKRAYKKGNLLLVNLFLVTLFVTFLLNSTEVMHRIQIGGLSGREYVWGPAVNMAADYFLFGSGMGTFQVAFTAYYPSPSQTWWHAHMNYLQLLIELGVIGFVIFASGTISVLIIVIRCFIKRNSPFYIGVMMGVLMATTSILLHELVDYHFFIPANAAYFYIILGIGMVASKIK